MLDVMFYEVFAEEEKALRAVMPDTLKAGYVKETIQERGSAELPAKIISVRTQSRIPAGWAGALAGILTRSQGYDHLVDYRRETGTKIPCGYLGDYCSRAVAEQAVMSLLFLLRRGHRQIRQFDAFDRDGLTGAEGAGKKALIVGVGCIGAQIADMAAGLKMEVKGVDIDPRLDKLIYVSLEEGVAWADVIFCALPLTDKTGGLLDYALLTRARGGVVLVNVSRGEITPLKDLARLMAEDKLGALALDVYAGEPLLAQCLRGAGHPKSGPRADLTALRRRDNVLLTPHNAFNTQEALERKARLSAQSVVKFVEEGSFLFAVPG